MRKWLVILGLLLASAPLVPGEPNQAAKSRQTAANQVQGEGSPVGAVKANKQNGGQADQAGPGCNSPTGNAGVERTLWWKDSNWWLVGIAFFTGCVICWQSIETRKSAQSAEKQITLQSNAMRQWVNIEPIKAVTPPTFKNPFEVTLQFEVRNRTDYLLTVKKIVAHAARGLGATRTFTVSCDAPIPPEKSDIDCGLPFYVGAFVERSDWDNRGTIFVVTREVTYRDCMEIERSQTFQDLFQGCEDGRFVKMKPSGLSPTVTDYKPDEDRKMPN